MNCMLTHLPYFGYLHLPSLSVCSIYSFHHLGGMCCLWWILLLLFFFFWIWMNSKIKKKSWQASPSLVSSYLVLSLKLKQECIFGLYFDKAPNYAVIFKKAFALLSRGAFSCSFEHRHNQFNCLITLMREVGPEKCTKMFLDKRSSKGLWCLERWKKGYPFSKCFRLKLINASRMQEFTSTFGVLWNYAY